MLTELRSKHSVRDPEDKNNTSFKWGINGNTVKIENMEEANIWDPCAVKIQTYKTAIESACMLLRIDDIVSGISKENKHAKGGRHAEDSDDGFGDDRDG